MVRMLGAVSCALLMIMTPSLSRADADGPDFFRVVGVASNDVLNIRTSATALSTKIGAIPHNGDGIRNLGCQGGLSYAEWSEATETERKAAERRRWCRISYKGVEGWVAGRFLGEGGAP